MPRPSVVVVLSVWVAGSAGAAQQAQPIPSPSSLVHGHVVAGADVPIARARVSVIYDHSRYLRLSPSDRDGRYVLSNLPPGDYSVVAVDGTLDGDDWQHPGVLNSLAAAARRIALAQGERATVDLRPAPLQR